MPVRAPGWWKPAIRSARASSRPRGHRTRRWATTRRCACWWSAAARGPRCSGACCHPRCWRCPRPCGPGSTCRCSTAATTRRRSRQRCAGPASGSTCAPSSTTWPNACAMPTWWSPAPVRPRSPTCWWSAGRRSWCRSRRAVHATSSAATPGRSSAWAPAGAWPRMRVASPQGRFRHAWRHCSRTRRRWPLPLRRPRALAGRTPPLAWPMKSRPCCTKARRPRTRGADAVAARDDVIIIGGGHNGLVCAAYLAGAGLKVRVLERRGIVGGAAVTEEFHPGFRNSVASYTVSLLDPRVSADLRLAEHGLRVVERPFSNFLPLPDGRAFRLGGEHGAAEVAKWSARDAERLPQYFAMLERVVAVLRELMLLTPPNVSDGFVLADWLGSFAVARRLRHLDMRGRRDLLDLFTKSAGELLDHWFESGPLKAALGWDSVVGNFASPYTPGSAYVLLHHVFGEVNGKQGAWGHAIGGMGAITQAMAAECAARGVTIETDAEVAQVLVEGGRAVGVALADGRELRARAVASNL